MASSDFEFTTPVDSSGVKRGPKSKNKALEAIPFGDDAVKDQAEVEQEIKDRPQYDPDELLKIFDDIIFQGEYSETVIIRNKLRVKFKTRSVEELETISRIIDGTTANLITTLNEKSSILNLQYALLQYQGTSLATESVEKRAKFIGSLPGPVVGALLKALNEFDSKVFAACRDSEENF